MKNGVHSMREALLAQALGDLDTLLSRAESFSTIVEDSEKRLQGIGAALDKSGEGYRLAVTAFTESAKEELTAYLQRQGQRQATETLADVQASMYAAAKGAFRSETSDKLAQLGLVLHRALRDLRRSEWTRFLQHLLTAAITSTFTAGLVLLVLGVPAMK